MTNSFFHPFTFSLFLHWVTGKSATKLLEYLAVNLAQHNGGVYLTAAQLGQLLQGFATFLVVVREYAQGYKHLVGMQTWVLTTQVFYLSLLNGFNQTL